MERRSLRSAPVLPSSNSSSIRHRSVVSPRLSPSSSISSPTSLYTTSEASCNPSAVHDGLSPNLGLAAFDDEQFIASHPTVRLVSSGTRSSESALPQVRIASGRWNREKGLPRTPKDDIQAHISETPHPALLTLRQEGLSRTATGISQNTASDVPDLPTPNYPNSNNLYDDAFSCSHTPDSAPSEKSSQSQYSDGWSTFRQVVIGPLHTIHSIGEETVCNGGSREPSTQSSLQASIPNARRFAASRSLNLFNRSSRPQNARTGTVDSSKSGGTADTRRTISSLDSGRTSLLTTVSTTEKFTHKWPQPRPLRGVSLKSRSDSSKMGKGLLTSIDNTRLSLETGAGLDIEAIGKWTMHKWFLMLSVVSVFIYGLLTLVYALMTWYRAWPQTDVMVAADDDILVLITLCSALLLFTSLVGTTGTLLNARPLLAIYVLLLWPAFISLLTVGYIGYKRATFSLDRKLDQAWSQHFSDADRSTTQDSLSCCGFYDSVHDAVVTSQCYPRSTLPGCKASLLRFERVNLARVWSMTFSFVPLHILNIIVALLCSNHVTRTFGKGIMPRQYWLGIQDVRQDAHALLIHFATDTECEDVSPTKRPPLARVGSNSSSDRYDIHSVPALGRFREMNIDTRHSSRYAPNTLRTKSIGLGWKEG